MIFEPMMKSDWARALFVDHPQVFLPWMKAQREQAKADVRDLRIVFEKFRVRDGARILDLACGIGRISINLARAGYQVVGVDISPLYLDFAKKWAEQERVTNRARFYKMDMRDYLIKHFEQESVSTLEGVEWHDSRRLNLERSFMENTWKFYRKKGRSRRLILRVPVSHRVYSVHELKRLLIDAGWK